MLNYGFSLCKNEVLLYKDEYIKTVPVKNAVEPYAQIIAKDNLSVTVKEGELSKVYVDYSLPDELEAPLEMGQEVGRAVAYFDNKAVASVSLINKNDIAQIEKKEFLNKIQQIILVIGNLFK